MPLPFPSIKLPMRLTPVGAGRSFAGWITLKSSGNDKFVEIASESGATGTATVTYSSVLDERGNIGPFSVVVTDGAQSSTWDFQGIAVFESRADLWVFSKTLTIDGVAFKMAGIPVPVKGRASARFEVSKNGTSIGDLLAITSPTINFIFFLPIGGGPILVDAPGNNVEWEFKGLNYSGFRFISDVTGNDPVPSYAGSATSRADSVIQTVDDWEATLISPFIALDQPSAAAATPLPFPTGQFQMVLVRPSDVSRTYEGTITLDVVNGNPSVTIKSGIHQDTASPAYNSSLARYGVIGPFNVTLGGVLWEFGRITVLEFVQKTYLASSQLKIGNISFNLTGLRIAIPIEQPVRGRFTVVRNGSEIGALVINSNTAGQFQPAGGGQTKPVQINNENVNWENGNEKFSGFVFILSLGYLPQTVVPKFGYLGSSVSTILSVNDWEATLIP